MTANATATATDPDPIGTTLATRTCRLLREGIISGELKAGEPLRFDVLRRAYGVSVTPLREALSLLAAERFVHQEDQRGFRVAPMSLDELSDLTERRIEMEPYALTRSIEAGDDEWEVALLGAQHRLTRVSERILAQRHGLDDEWESRHRELHLGLLSACGSPWLMRFCSQLYDHFDRYRRVAGRHPGTMKSIVTNREDQIVATSLARQTEKARELLARHIRESADDIHRTLRKAGVPQHIETGRRHDASGDEPAGVHAAAGRVGAAATAAPDQVSWGAGPKRQAAPAGGAAGAARAGGIGR